MKNTLYVFVVIGLLLTSNASAQIFPLSGKIIALDAGHGGGETGAVGKCGADSVVEADVNEAVRAALKSKIELAGGVVFEVPRISSRKERVQAAESNNSDVLISIHHNGSSNLETDYTRSYVTQRNDKILAAPIHKALVARLGLSDRGIKNDGYGMTVYGSLPGILTEAYFITDTDEACDFTGPKLRVEAEAEALYEGLVGYFSN